MSEDKLGWTVHHCLNGILDVVTVERLTHETQVNVSYEPIDIPGNGKFAPKKHKITIRSHGDNLHHLLEDIEIVLRRLNEEIKEIKKQ